MDITTLREIFTRQQRIELDDPSYMRREANPPVIRHFEIDGSGAYVIYSLLNEETADAVIEQQIAHFRQHVSRFEWKLYDYDLPPDLGERLAAHGLVPEEPDAVMIMDAEEAPELLQSPVKLDVRRILDPKTLDDLVGVERQVWGKEEEGLGNRLRTDLLKNPDGLSVYIVYDGYTAVCGAWTYFHPPSQFASFWGGATLSSHRKRGFYTAVLAVRVQEARQRGFRFLTVDASPMSRPILEKHGFRCIGMATPYIWTAEGKGSLPSRG